MTLEKLKACRAWHEEIEGLHERILRLRAARERICAAPCGAALGTGGVAPDRMAEQLQELMELEEALARAVLGREKAIAEVEAWIGRLPHEEATVMRLRYIEGLPWRQVESRAGYAQNNSTGYKLQRSALKRL